jgi:hypothetical protein
MRDQPDASRRAASAFPTVTCTRSRALQRSKSGKRGSDRRPCCAYASDIRPPAHRHPEQDRRLPPGAAGAQSRPDIERAADILWFDFGHRSWRRRAALLLGRRIALACRASLGRRFSNHVHGVTDRPDSRSRHHVPVRCHPGGEHEELVDGRPQPGRPQRDQVGDVSAFAPPGDIHRVRNVSETTAISVHTTAPTSPGIGSGAPRRCYDWPRWKPKVKPPPDYRRSSSRVTRLRPPVLDLTRRLRHR